MTEEQYTWHAEVEGKLINEGDGVTVAEICDYDLGGKVNYFTITSPGNKFNVTIKLGGNRRLIFFRRRMHHVSNVGGFDWTLTCVGWQEKVRGVSRKTLLYLYPNGNIEVNDDEPTLATAYHEKLIELLNQNGQV